MEPCTIVLDINHLIDRLHGLLLETPDNFYLDSIKSGMLRFSPDRRLPIEHLKKNEIGKYISTVPYLSFIGVSTLEAYLNSLVLKIASYKCEDDYFYNNRILRRYGLEYTVFEPDDRSLMAMFLDSEEIYGRLSGDICKKIFSIEANIKLYMNKLEPMISNRICSVDLSREYSILNIGEDIRDYRLRETEEVLDANGLPNNIRELGCY